MTRKPAVSMQGMLALFLLLLFTTQSLLADVTAQLGRSTIYAGDTVTLMIEATGRDPGGQPDLSVLEPDFEILGTSTSQQVQVINGRRSEKRQWQVELDPLRAGTLQIPPISVGSAETPPLELEVREQPAAQLAGADQPVFLRAAIEPVDGNVFVQQQIGLSVQLYFRVPLSEGGFDVLNVEHAVVEQLGEDTRYRTTLNGQQYQVVERRYAIFPEQSGALTIPAVTFTGRVRSAASSRSPFSGMDDMMERFFSSGDRGQRVRVRSEPLTIDVRPRPDSYSGTAWLPSEQLVLYDSWAREPPEFRVGEPVTRTIDISARGLAASQLPELELPAPAGMRLYPETVQRDSRTDGNLVLGRSTQSIAYVPSTAGKITIPEVRVDWWDVRNQRQQTAVLPAWEINVTGEAGSVPPTAPVNQAPAQAATPPPQQAAARDEAGLADHGSMVAWLAGIAAGALLLAAFLLFYILRTRSRRVPVATASVPETPRPPPASASVDALQRACTANDADAAAKALLQWAATQWPEAPPTSLGALAQRISSGAAAVRALDEVLYAPGKQAWQGRDLWAAFQQGLDSPVENTQSDSEALSPLYPDWDRK